MLPFNLFHRLSSIGCSVVITCGLNAPIGVLDPHAMANEPEASENIVKAFLEDYQEPQEPLRVALIDDKSLSGPQHRVKGFAENHIDQLSSIIMERGGEIAYTTVCVDSNRPATRVYVPARPAFDKESLNLADKPEEPDGSNINPFELGAAHERHEEAMTDFQELQNKDIHAVEEYKKTGLLASQVKG